MDFSAEYWVQQLNLTPHPEGGYYKETIRTDATNQMRGSVSSIYFMLKTGDISHFHRIDADEIWYYHAGVPLTIHMITPQGDYQSVDLGPFISKGNVMQCIVPKGTIFASSLIETEGYSLVGCMCQPAFDFNHFELFSQQELLDEYPQHKEIIQRYALENKQ